MDLGENSSSSTTKSEVLIRRILSDQLVQGETLIEGIRFTDPKHGDVEIDFLILIPGSGVAVVEVKGGVVSFQDGQWLTTTKGGSRRISPIEQARKAKHALRRFLDRSPDWKNTHATLIRAQWFVVMPYTDVTGDLGTEGRREQLMGASDLDALLPKIRETLSSTLVNDPAPNADDLDVALTLLLGLQKTKQPPIAPSLSHRMNERKWTLIAAGSGVVAALAIGGVLSSNLISPASANCNSNYEPCIPVATDLSCSEIRMVVQVVGEDSYGLDRDGDGYGCEIYK
jgi:hypothetical protein